LTTLESKIRSISNLSAEAVTLLCSVAVPLHLKKGEALLKEGQVCKKFNFIEKGCLRSYQLKDGKEMNINFHFENRFVSNVKSLLSQTPSDYFISAVEPSIVHQFHRPDMFRIYEQSNEIVTYGKSLLEQIVVEQEEHINLLKLYTAEERYDYLQQHNPALLQRVSLTQLASYLGVARETLSRIRGR
jgi:CRP-like cAMP-binding protein